MKPPVIIPNTPMSQPEQEAWIAAHGPLDPRDEYEFWDTQAQLWGRIGEEREREADRLTALAEEHEHRKRRSLVIVIVALGLLTVLQIIVVATGGGW